MSGGLLLAIAIAVPALVATGVTLRRLAVTRRTRGGWSRPLTGLAVVLAATTLALPGIALAASGPGSPAESAAPAQPHHPGHHPGPHPPPPPSEPPAPGQHTTTVRFGPLLLPPAVGAGGGGAHEGGHGGQMVSYATPAFEVPCHDCYVTGIQPDLVYADGTPANHHTGAMLHHAVLFDPSKTDTTCGRRGVGLVTGQRVFAAGNERTGAQLPPGYGYHLGTAPLGAVTELMSMSAQPQQVYLTMRVTWVDARDAQLRAVTPVWLDIDNCGDSQYSVPAGPSHETWTWRSTLAGDIVAAAGHVHDHGISVTLSNATRGETICASHAGYGAGSHHGDHAEGHVESMSTCVGDPVATVARGDDLVLDSAYDSPAPDDTVMGIMLLYLHETPTP